MITIPTALTLGRLFMLPFLIAALVYGHYWTAFILYTIGGATDWLDGWIARKYNQISEFGTFLDPISDKIYVCTLFLALIAAEHVGPYGFIAISIILAREFLVSGLREYLGPKGIKIPVSQLAKWKTTLQMVATGILIVAPVLPFATEIGSISLFLATALTCITGWDYLKTALAHMK